MVLHIENQILPFLFLPSSISILLKERVLEFWYFGQDGPILKEARTRPIRRSDDAGSASKQKMAVRVDKARLERWKATGVVALAESNLMVKIRTGCYFFCEDIWMIFIHYIFLYL